MKIKCTGCKKIEDDGTEPFIFKGEEEIGSFYHKECLPDLLKLQRRKDRQEHKRKLEDWGNLKGYYEKEAGLGRIGYKLSYGGIDVPMTNKKPVRTYQCVTTHDETSHLCSENMKDKKCICTSCVENKCIDTFSCDCGW